MEVGRADGGGDLIVFAHAYDSEAAAKQQLNAYRLWAARELPDVAAASWRIRLFTGRHVVVVYDESGRALVDFTWKGERHELPPKVVESFTRKAEGP